MCSYLESPSPRSSPRSRRKSSTTLASAIQALALPCPVSDDNPCGTRSRGPIFVSILARYVGKSIVIPPAATTWCAGSPNSTNSNPPSLVNRHQYRQYTGPSTSPPARPLPHRYIPHDRTHHYLRHTFTPRTSRGYFSDGYMSRDEIFWSVEKAMDDIELRI